MDDDYDVACVAGAFLILAYAYITKRQIERRMGSHKKRHRRNSSSSSSSSSSDDRLSHKRKLTGPLDISKKKRRKIQKRKRSPSSSSGSENLSSSSSSSSITSSSSSSEDERHQKKKEKMKLKRLKPKKECKHKKVDKEKVEKLKNSKKEEKLKPEEPEKSSDIPIDLMDKAKAMAPMTKEQWEKKQSVVRRVYDESTGRHRLIKGDGEVIEEPVSKDRHKAINKQATKGDGKFFQSQMRK